MRMKRKKNLDERIDAASDYLIIMNNDSLDFNDADKENHLIDFKKVFKKEQPVYLEVGSGKGQFGCTFAKQNPDKNILCVERNRNVLILAIDMARDMGLDNIMFLCGTAEYLPSYIEKQSVEEIYLNFSCPFPKNRHKAHRLTNPRFLEIFKTLLKPNGVICQKTDNMHFFEYSIEVFLSAVLNSAMFRWICITVILREILLRNMSQNLPLWVARFTVLRQGFYN